jgi:putative phosphonate transport system ATP-binding protein
MQCLYFDQVATAGTVRAVAYDGGEANLLELSSQQKRKVRNTVLGMVYQNPYLGLRMNFSSLSNIAEQMIAAGNRSVESMRARGNELLGKVNIPPFACRGCAGNVFRRHAAARSDCQGAFEQPARVAFG